MVPNSQLSLALSCHDIMSNSVLYSPKLIKGKRQWMGKKVYFKMTVVPLLQAVPK